MYRFVDSHIHAHEYGEEFIRKYCRDDYIYLAVSDDYESSLKTLELSRKCKYVIPAVGLHPWEVNKDSLIDVDKISELARKVHFLGEVGLDKKFVSGTWDLQLRVFNRFLDIAESLGLGLSIHAAGAWKEVLEILRNRNVKVAIIHWYTGPLELIEEIESLGFFIGVNPAIKIQKKMQDVVKAAPLDIMVTESDGPYNYRGLNLGPELILGTIDMIAKIKNLDVDLVIEVICKNFMRILGRVNVSIW